jgi:hypothetical protein
VPKPKAGISAPELSLKVASDMIMIAIGSKWQEKDSLLQKSKEKREGSAALLVPFKDLHQRL